MKKYQAAVKTFGIVLAIGVFTMVYSGCDLFKGKSGDAGTNAVVDTNTPPETNGATQTPPDTNGVAPQPAATISDAIAAGDLKKAEELITGGADVNAANEKGETALHVAVAQKNLDAVKLLVEKGADITAKTADGKTADALAQELGFTDALLLLQPQEPVKTK